MHPDLPRLAELQELDLRLAAMTAELAKFPARLAAAAALAESARLRVKTAKDAHLQSLKDRKTFEMDVEQWRERVRKYKDQSGQVKSNEAYRALLHEIEGAEAEVGKAEDRLLDRMMASEELEREIKAAETALGEAEAEAAAQKRAVESERAALETEFAQRKELRDLDAAAVDPDLLDLYLRIAVRHAGLGIAQVTPDESCGACRVRVRPHTFQKLRDPNHHELIRCETCTRILYYVAPPEAPKPVDAAAAAASASSQGSDA